MTRAACRIGCDEHCEPVERLVRDRNTPQKVVWRAPLALLLHRQGSAWPAEGRHPPVAGQAAFAKGRATGAHDAAQEAGERDSACASMAKAAGISYSSVQRIWHAHGLKPHLIKAPSR